MSEITVFNNQNHPLMVSSNGLMAIPGKPVTVDSEDKIANSVIKNRLVTVLSPQKPVEVAESTQETIPTEEEISPEVISEDSVAEPEAEPEETEEAPEAEKSTSTRTTRKKTSTQVKES